MVVADFLGFVQSTRCCFVGALKLRTINPKLYNTRTLTSQRCGASTHILEFPLPLVAKCAKTRGKNSTGGNSRFCIKKTGEIFQPAAGFKMCKNNGGNSRIWVDLQTSRSDDTPRANLCGTSEQCFPLVPPKFDGRSPSPKIGTPKNLFEGRKPHKLGVLGGFAPPILPAEAPQKGSLRKNR